MRCLKSIEEQEYKDYEVVITQEGSMSENTNAGIRKARGEIIKILYMDDFFSSPFSLDEIANAFAPGIDWVVTGCSHTTDGNNKTNPHYATWSEDIKKGVNTIGSPSVLAVRRSKALLFDEVLTWVLDCDYYWRMYQHYGPPKVVNALNVVIGLHEGQKTNLLSDEAKLSEYNYMKSKYLL